MRLHPMWGFVLFLLAMLAAGTLSAADIPNTHETRSLEGFTVYVNKDVLARRDDGYGRRPLDVLEKELNDLKRILKPRIVGVLQSVPIWVEWDETDKLSPGAVARYYGGPAEGLLKLGGDPRKANCVEVVTLRALATIRKPGTSLQQIIILHEMAHVVQHRLLGWDNPELEATFKLATDRKLYESVNDRIGRRTRAYARTNAAEYFAELSCAYLDSCNYYPFNNQQLQGYDPQGYAFVDRVWREPERFQIIAVQAGTASPTVRTTAPTGAPARVDVTTERDAMLRLDKLRALVRAGKKDQARSGLEELVKRFPNTSAARTAGELLSTLK